MTPSAAGTHFQYAEVEFPEVPSDKGDKRMSTVGEVPLARHVGRVGADPKLRAT
jgi:hypothetical protein